VTLLDSVILFVVLVSALIGVVRGFVREVLSILSWLLAIVVAFSAYDAAAARFFTFLADSDLRRLVAFIAILVLTLAAATLVSQLIRYLIHATGLLPVDRLLGLFFGLLRGVVVVAVVAVLVADTELARERWWRESLLVGRFTQTGQGLLALLPERIAHQLGDR
jgi:membrane protein required for colicin V production